MQLSTTGYFADYYLYGGAVAGLTVATLATTPIPEWGGWALAYGVGIASWTFAEYQLHRWILHHVPYVKEMHEAHHHDQKALIGTPGWLSFALFTLLIFLPAFLIAGFSLGGAFTAGFTFGYLIYITVHHGVHHWRIRPGGYLYRLKHRHALHHHFDDEGNYGVITSFWDRVFRTNIRVRDRREAEASH